MPTRRSRVRDAPNGHSFPGPSRHKGAEVRRPRRRVLIKIVQEHFDASGGARTPRRGGSAKFVPVQMTVEIGYATRTVKPPETALMNFVRRAAAPGAVGPIAVVEKDEIRAISVDLVHATTGRDISEYSFPSMS